MLYEPNTKLKDLTFEQLLELMKPRIEFHCHNNLHRFPGYDFDDIYQELSEKLWKVWKKGFPMEDYDWRFLQYTNYMFKNHILKINRKFLDRTLYNKGQFVSKDP